MFVHKNFIIAFRLLYIESRCWIEFLVFCLFRWRSGSRIAEPKSGSWSRRSWASPTAAAVRCTATRARSALCPCPARSAPRTRTVPCTPPRAWTPSHPSGIYSQWLWAREAGSPLDHQNLTEHSDSDGTRTDPDPRSEAQSCWLKK